VPLGARRDTDTTRCGDIIGIMIRSLFQLYMAVIPWCGYVGNDVRRGCDHVRLFSISERVYDTMRCILSCNGHV